MNRFALIIEASDVEGQTALPGAKQDAINWYNFLTSNVGGGWRQDEIVILNKPSRTLVACYLVYNYWDVKNSVEAHNHLKTLKLWERIYLEEGEKGFMEEKRGRAKGGKKGRPPKVPLPPDVEKDLIEENQQLRMEIEYIKKLSALVLANERARKNKQK